MKRALQVAAVLLVSIGLVASLTAGGTWTNYDMAPAVTSSSPALTSATVTSGVNFSGAGTCGTATAMVDLAGITGCYPTTDTATAAVQLQGESALPGAATNTTGGSVILAPGQGATNVTITTFGNCAGDTVTVTVNGTATVRTEGVNWTASGSNATTCASLATTIGAISGIDSTRTLCTGARLDIYLSTTGHSLSVATSDATCDTVANGTDGDITLYGVIASAFPSTQANAIWLDSAKQTGLSMTGTGTTRWYNNNSFLSWSGNALTFNNGATISMTGGTFTSATTTGTTASGTTITSGGTNDYLWSYTHTLNDAGAAGGSDVYRMHKMTLTETSTVGWNNVYFADYLVGSTSKYSVADTGQVKSAYATPTAATMTATSVGVLSASAHRYSWTNAMVVALGATTAGDITVATLPAKAVVTNAYVVIDTACAGTTTLTVAVGRTSASYIDYIVASDAKAAANTVYGDASAERGTNLVGYDLPSVTGTTSVVAHFVSTGANLSAVTTCTGSVYLETTQLP